MNTHYVKEDFIDEHTRRHESAGLLIARLAIVFAMVCVLSALVMVLGK